MNSRKPRFEIPRRIALATQVEAALRAGIRERMWEGELPGVRRLREIFQVGIPTLQTALHALARDGLVQVRPRRNARIRPGPADPKRPAHPLIVFIVREATSRLGIIVNLGVSEIRAQVARKGFATEILLCKARGRQAQQREIESFLRRNPPSCCVLVSSTKELQKWFSLHSVPALILGSCHRSAQLPSLDVDYRSVCRHAAGILLGQGHRQIALVVPDSGYAGDLASEEGFHEAVAQSRHSGGRAMVVRHQGTARSVAARLDVLFRSTQAPTALVVAKAEYVFMVLIYLLNRGLKVPDAVSLIARDWDYSFETLTPAITHYGPDDRSYIRKSSRFVIKMLDQGRLPLRPHYIFPEFVPGGTVKPRP